MLLNFSYIWVYNFKNVTLMRKITFLSLLLTLFFTWQGISQAVNEPANWPNTNWTLNVIAHTGSNPQDIEADPTTSDHFAYDDDDTGSGSHDEIAAESPVIDISAAQAAGENYIIISGNYVYNNNSSSEYLAIEYWDADASSWVLLHEFPDADTPGAPSDNYCSGTPESYVASLDISSFTSSQLSGFKYRFIYNDDTSGGNGWRWGFCFSSPILTSASTLYNPPAFTLTVVPDCNNNQFSVDVEVTDLGGASSVTVSDDQGSTPQQLTAPGTVTFGPYASGTDVTFTVTNDDDNTYTSSDNLQYYCPPANDDCSGVESLTVYPEGGGSGNETSASTSVATDSGQHPSCDNVGTNLDLWYSFIAPSSGSVKVITGGTEGSDIEAALYDSCGGAELACEGQSAEKIFTGLTSGNTYILQVWHDSSNAGDFTIVLEEFTPPANDDCANAIDVSSLPYTNTQDASNATNNAGFIDCNGNGMNDGVWYKFTTGTVNGDITIEVAPQGWDAEVAVYTGSCGSLNCEARADSYGTGSTETITFTPTANTTYYVNIGYWSGTSNGAEGPFTITISGNVTLNVGELTKNDFSFYPNPSSNTISWYANGSVEKIQITNLTGQVVMEVENPVDNSLNIAKLNQGVYLLHVFMDGKEGTYKLIKE